MVKGKKAKKEPKKKPVAKKVKKEAKAKKKVSAPAAYQLQVELKDLLEAGCHFGHSISRTDPRAKPYLYTVRNNVQIFDLIQTYDLLKKACEVVFELGKQGKKIVFLGSKRQAREIVESEAKEAGLPYVVNRWPGGTVTNWPQIKKSIDKLVQLKKEWQAGEYSSYTKHEQSLIKKEINRLEGLFGGLVDLDKIFEAIFVVDIRKERNAIREIRNSGVVTIAIVDSNSDPNLVDYPIPANDDAARSIQLITREVAKAYQAGKKLAVDDKGKANEKK